MNIESKRRKDHYEAICFTEEDFGISALIHNFLVKQIMVDQGNSIDILYSHVVKVLGIPKGMYKLYNDTLIGFT